MRRIVQLAIALVLMLAALYVLDRAMWHPPARPPSHSNVFRVPVGNGNAAERPLVEVQAMPLHRLVAPGESTMVAIMFTIPAKWHIYWADAGDAGVPTEVHFKAPTGVTVGPAVYSRPMLMDDPAGKVFGYERSALLLAPVTIASDIATRGWIDIQMEANWLVCKKVCHIGSVAHQLRVEVGQEMGKPTAAAQWARAFSMPKAITKRPGTNIQVDAKGVTISGPMGELGLPSFIPQHVPGVELAQTSMSQDGGLFTLSATYKLRPGDSFGHKPRIQGLLTFGTRPADPCWSIDAVLPIPSQTTEGNPQ